MLCISLTVVVTVAAAPANAQLSEAELKGRMVGVLGAFDARAPLVTWPMGNAPGAANPLKIGILGDDPFVDDNGVNYLTKRLPKAKVLRFATAEDFADCHILVISTNSDFEKAIEKTKDLPTLVVTESPGLAKRGSVINLVYDPNTNKIRMEINPTTATRLKLTINRDLLRSPLVDIVAGN